MSSHEALMGDNTLLGHSPSTNRAERIGGCQVGSSMLAAPAADPT
jgi:hypothetical protein